MNIPALLDLFKELVTLGVILLVLVLIGVILSLIKKKNETANTWKFRTWVFTVLALLALVVPQIWLVMTPLYLVLAYRSYKAGRADASHPAGVVSSGTHELGFFGKLLRFNIALDYWPLPIHRIIEDKSAFGIFGKLIRFKIALDYWPLPIFNIIHRKK